MTPRAQEGPAVLRLAAFLAAYAGAYAVGRFLGERGPGMAAFWPAAGLLAAGAIATTGRARIVLLAATSTLHAFLSLLWGVPAAGAAGCALASAVLGAVAASLHTRWVSPAGELRGVRQVFAFSLGVAPAAALAASATAGLVQLLAASDGTPAAPTLRLATTWFVATLLGTLVVGPVLLTRLPGAPAAGSAARPGARSHGRTAARVLLVVGLVAVTLLASGQPWLLGREAPGLRYAPLPLLVWAAFRLGPADTAAASLFVCLGATGFRHMDPAADVTDLLWLQSFLVTAHVTALALSAACAERRGAEERLAERTDFLGRVVETARIGVWAFDPGTERVHVDDGWRAMLGHPPEVADLTLDEALSQVHPEDRDAATARWRAFARDGGGPLDVVLRVRRADGEWGSVLARGSVQRDAGGRPLRIVGTCTDVTELRRAEEAARVAEARFRAAAEGGLDAFCLLASARDASGAIEDFTVAYMNRNGAWMFGRRVEDVVGRRLGDAFPEFRTAGFVHRLTRAATTGRLFSEEMRLDVPGARAVQVHVQVVATPDGVAVLLRDLTEQRRLERDLRQAQKMEGLGRLAGGVAHDFNNLLTVMRGYCEIAKTHVGPGSPALPMLEQVVDAADRAAELTSRLLTFSRREKVEMRPADANALVFGVEKMLRRLIGEDVHVEVSAAPRAAWTVVEPGGLEQAVMNLAVNARDAMPAGGRLSISVSVVRLGEADAVRIPHGRAGEFVRIEVADTGCGMTPEVLSHIFEPFFTTKPAGRGTGLGLAICYGVVRQAGGFISVESEVDRGTRFHVHLPVAEVPTDEIVAPPPGVVPRDARETILVVEDEAAVRRILVDGLRQAGWRVLEAADGNAALVESRRNEGSIDLLVTDVVMPGFRGPEVAALLRAERPGLRVLFVSGYTGEAFAGAPEGDGPPVILHKPFTIAALHAKVRELLATAPVAA